MKIAAVVVAAGSSRRMGRDKLWLPLAGKPVAAHCLIALQACPEIAEIVLVTRAESIPDFQKLADAEGVAKLKAVVEGGKERQDSVWNGLRATSEHCDIALVHDAARPFLCREIILPVARAAADMGAAVCGVQVTDTIKEIDASGLVLRTPPRDTLMAVQTPQIFRRALLLEAYASLAASGKQVTDDTAAVESIGHPVRVVPVDLPNLKITHPDDLPFAEQLFARRLTVS